jgi:dGTP triphosphohydrolase
MDAADDIAFSTSDLEDSLKGGFMSVMDMLACSHQLAAQVAQKIGSDPEAHQLADFTVADVRRVLRDIAAMGLAHVSGEFLLFHASGAWQHV